MAHGPKIDPAACFCIQCMGMQPQPSLGAFCGRSVLHWQSASCHRDHAAHEPQIFTLWPFTEGVCQPCAWPVIFKPRLSHPWSLRPGLSDSDRHLATRPAEKVGLHGGPWGRGTWRWSRAQCSHPSGSQFTGRSPGSSERRKIALCPAEMLRLNVCWVFNPWN